MAHNTENLLALGRHSGIMVTDRNTGELVSIEQVRHDPLHNQGNFTKITEGEDFDFVENGDE